MIKFLLLFYLKDSLKLSGKVKKLSRLIFGTGEALQAITITSNHGIVRAAKNQVHTFFPKILKYLELITCRFFGNLLK